MADLFVIAGHGEGDPGACGNGYSEAERVRTLARRIKEMGGSRVTLGDMNMDYYARNAIAALNISKNTQIVELHMDWGVNSARGGHVIINGRFKPDAYDRKLAENITSVFPGRASKIVGRTDLQNPNTAARVGYGYRLVECGFISNATDVQIFNNRMDDVAKAILSAFDVAASDVPPSNPVAPSPTPTPSAPGINFTYSVRAGGEVWPAVTNLGDWAGKGDGTPITDIAIKVDKGSIRYRVHVLGGGWLPWVTGYDWNDTNNGYAGIGKDIDGIQIYYETPADYAAKYGWQKAQYRVSSLEGREYYDWQYDNETHSGQDGYAGKLGVAIDKFQLF